MEPQIVHASFENKPFTWALWTPLETDDELVRLWELTHGAEEIPRIKSPHRLREWLGSRILMSRLGIEGASVLPNGKPVLPHGALSLSHCRGSVAVATCGTNIGLDIQFPTEQIRVIRSKFCSPSEWGWLETHEESLRALTIVWGAKEAIFKYWGERVDFAADVEVFPFRCDDSRLTARYAGKHGTRDFVLWHATVDGLELVIAF